MTSNRNRNVALTVLLDADRKGLLLLTDDGQEIHVGVGPNTGDTIRDWLLINERRQPRDERNDQPWHTGDAAGRLVIKNEIDDFLEKGGTIKRIEPVKRGFQKLPPEEYAKRRIAKMSDAEKAMLLALLNGQEVADEPQA